MAKGLQIAANKAVFLSLVPGMAWQVKESREGGKSKVHKLKKSGLTFGRSPDADVVVLVSQ